MEQISPHRILSIAAVTTATALASIEERSSIFHKPLCIDRLSQVDLVPSGFKINWKIIWQKSLCLPPRNPWVFHFTFRPREHFHSLHTFMKGSQNHSEYPVWSEYVRIIFMFLFFPEQYPVSGNLYSGKQDRNWRKVLELFLSPWNGWIFGCTSGAEQYVEYYSCGARTFVLRTQEETVQDVRRYQPTEISIRIVNRFFSIMI